MLFSKYGGDSLHLIVEKLYPDTTWHTWRFNPVSRGYWESMENQAKYLQWFQDRLEINQPSDWYGITNRQFASYHGGGLIQQEGKLTCPETRCQEIFFLVGGVMNILKKHYPDNQWDISQWYGHVNSKAQWFLYKVVRDLFPNYIEVYYNHNIRDMLFQESKISMTVDIWIPHYRIGLEFQGKQHYMATNFLGDFELQLRRDTEKSMACKMANITLIAIPYWWDMQASSLSATLRKV
jgi:hypothetical protein